VKVSRVVPEVGLGSEKERGVIEGEEVDPAVPAPGGHAAAVGGDGDRVDLITGLVAPDQTVCPRLSPPEPRHRSNAPTTGTSATYLTLFLPTGGK